MKKRSTSTDNNLEMNQSTEIPQEDTVQDNTKNELTQDESIQQEIEVGELDQNESDSDDLVIELQNQLAEVREQMIRKVADLENYKKRLEREKMMTFEFAKTDAISRFLPVYDDLKRSLDASKDVQVDAVFLEGVKMVSDKFSDILAQYGVKRIDELMVPFNVQMHEALLRQKHDDPTVQPNTVIMVLEPGYMMGDKVIRHAKVMVSE